MNCISNFKKLCIKSAYVRHFCNQKMSLSYTKFGLSVKGSRRYITCVNFRSFTVSSKLFQTADCFNTLSHPFKTSKRKMTTSSGKGDSDASEDEEDESFSDIEPDYDAPLNYEHSLVNSHRADVIIGKGLSMSARESERMFYDSKFLFVGKTLLKKAKKLDDGDCIDVIHKEENGKLLVQRVKVVKTLSRLTKKGKPVIVIRVWKKPFEIDKQES